MGFQIGLGEAGAPARGPDFLGHGGALRFCPVHHDDVRAFGRQAPGRCPAHALGGAGDQGHQALETLMCAHV
ncbi:hypothetical protein D3C71_2075900 [compost metagenome]